MTLRGALMTWAALALLLTATVILAHVPMGAGNAVASLAIAFAKAALIMLIYMKLWRGPALNQLAAGVLLLWLAVMVGLTFTDYLTRPEIATAPETDLPPPGPLQPIP